MRRVWFLAVLAAALPAAASAEGYRHGRLRYVEEGVSIQRGVETGTEEAAANMPFLPGDRVWTNGGGRVEFQFAAGSIVRLDSGSKLDYVAHDEDRDERVALRLWSGALYLHTRDSRDPAFEVETPGGVITTRGRGLVRIDVQGGEARVSVFEGEASLEGGRGARLRAGERAYAQRGEVVDGPESFDRADGDDFASWDQERRERTAYASGQPSYLPDDVAPYRDELEANGSWYYQQEVGHVWRPYVSAGWQPYSHGRWIWTIYGWTWVAAEPWGWAPSHFGRWGFTPALGWYWIPGRNWGPAWVSWAYGGDYVGWCPLGYRDRPVLVYGHRDGGWSRGRRSGQAVPRGSVPSGVGSPNTTVASAPWMYMRRGDLTARDLAKRRVQPEGAALAQIRMLDGTQARLTRNVTLGDGPSMDAARARTMRSRPATMDGTGGEARPDPMAAVPVTATPRRMPREPEVMAAPAVPSGDSFDSGAATRRSRTGDEGVVRSRPADRAPEGGVMGGRVSTPERERERDRTMSTPPARQDSDREVLRPVFKPLGRPRDEDRGGDSGARRRGGEERGGESGVMRPRSGGESQPRSRGGEAWGGGGGGESRPREMRPRDTPRAEPPPRQAAPPPPPPRREETPAREGGGAKRRRDG